MESSSIAPPPPPAPPTAAVPFPAEPIPEPPPANHPPYAQMIYTAIEALKEKNGSSKRAISKYIEQVYKEQLPPNHSTLLTQHLTRLKSDGILQMNKNSYIIPRSAPVPVPGTGLGLGPGPAVPPSDSQSPRPRGRPRKAQTLPVSTQDIPLSAQDAPLSAQDVPLPAQDVANLPIQQNAEPVWAALGLTDEPVQVEGSIKRRGRPKKSDKAGSGSGRRGRPPGSVKKPIDTDGGSAVFSGPKRGPGRPPKNATQATPIPFAPVAAAAGAAAAGAEPVAEPDGNAGAGATAVLGPRSRGRPKKFSEEGFASGRGRGRGRGRGGGGGRGRGRGRRGGLMLVPVLPRKPLGRPKGSTSANSSKKAAADLRRKLEHFQSKVKESLAVLKPHFNHESPVTAIAAIQDLEELGTMNLNEPLRDEAPPQQEEVPPPQPPVVKPQPSSPLQVIPPQPQQPLPQQQQPPQQPVTQQLLQPPQPFHQNFPQFHQQPPQYQQPAPFQQLQFQQPQQPQPQPQTHSLFQAQPPHHQQFHP